MPADMPFFLLSEMREAPEIIRGFDPARVARAGRKLGIISDARYRFERGVDPQSVLPGLELCTQLILDWCGGEPSEVVIAGELPPPHKHIDFDPALVEMVRLEVSL